MSEPNVILTGFMGTGKSAVGRVLAERLGYRFVDTDELIVKRAGKTIRAIFGEEGEASFRHWEAMIAAELQTSRGLVIATGGGLMLDPDNARRIASSGTVYCLTARPEEILERLSDETGQRPLLSVSDPLSRIKELLAERADSYARYPQIATDDKPIAVIAREIQSLMDGRIITVTHPQGSYDVVIGASLLRSLPETAGDEGPLAIITDSNVGPLYAEQCAADVLVTMPAGEAHKTLSTVTGLYTQLLNAGIDRQATIVALGGGVVGDVAGFVAATYMRGVKLIQCPTSLLAMVDASVGGKTGVDLPQGKNLVGAFKQPEAVIADLATLSTLPQAEFSAGMAEVVKSGIIGDPSLFQLLGEESASLLDLGGPDIALLRRVIGDSIEVKRAIVEADPYEQGRRAVLNLGHTFGHAIERVSGYQVRHGDAVAMGLVAAAHLSAIRGQCAPELEEQIARLLHDLLLPTSIPSDFTADEIFAAMASDKKKVTGRLRFVLLRAIGDVFVSDQVMGEEVLATLRHCGSS